MEVNRESSESSEATALAGLILRRTGTRWGTAKYLELAGRGKHLILLLITIGLALSTL